MRDSNTAKHNMGGKLSALVLEAGALLTRDVEEITREVDLPGSEGRVTATLHVTGPLAFLVHFAQALVGPTARDKPKDAYDIVWLIESWPGGPAAAAADFSRRAAYPDPGVAMAMESLGSAFADIRQVGARSYARFAARDLRQQPRFERHAVVAVQEFLDALP